MQSFLGIDIAKRKFDAVLLVGTGTHAARMALEAGNLWTGARTRIETALRADLGLVDADRADQRPTVTGAAAAIYNLTPRELYRRYYGGTGATSRVETEIGGCLRAEYDLSPEWIGHLDLRRAIRLPELTELYYGNSGTAALAQVGNPALDPEKHHRAETGLTAKSNGYGGYGRTGRPGTIRLTAGIFADRIHDFISIDHARGQSGVAASDGGLVYRNVEAAIGGIDGEFQANLAEYLSARLHLTGQRGRNLTDGRPLYQVPPLEANLFLDVFGRETGWNLGTRIRLVASKMAVDDSSKTGSGQDTGGPAGGFATADLYAGYVLGDRLGLSAGVENIFDKLYREHLATFPQTPATTVQNAPGRTAFIRAMLAF